MSNIINLIKYFKLFYFFMKCSLINNMEYAFNFVAGFVCELSWMIMNLIFFNVLYLNVTEICGWTKYEILLLVVITGLMDSIMTCFFQSNLGAIPSHVKNGTLDLLLLKPANKRFLLSFKTFSFPQTVNIVINILLIIYMIKKLNIILNIGNIIVFCLLFLNGVFIMYNLFFLVMLMSFWSIESGVNLWFFYQLFQIGNKPMDIFQGVLQKVFIYLIPIFVAFNYPVIYISKGLSLNNLVLPFIISICFFCITQFVFKKALEKYSSASS